MFRLRAMNLIAVNFFQLTSNGMHLGHNIKSVNFFLDYFFVGRRYSVIILNLLISIISLRRASILLSGTAMSRGFVLFVLPAWFNTSVFFFLRRKVFLIEEPFWANLWISGFLTNYKRVFAAYVTYACAEELTRKQKKILAILSLDVLLESLPGAVISLNKNMGNLAVVEASALRIPTIGLLDSNVGGGSLMLPIPSNDDSFQVMFFHVLFFSKVIVVFKMRRLKSFVNFFSSSVRNRVYASSNQREMSFKSGNLNVYNLLNRYKLMSKKKYDLL